ncbi:MULTISPECIES: YbgC/FadM family acyl-CoA thioesterase [Brucella/Ochrobactrum group]|uniref:YbgC/FadM family acyl-CoA thioesterase n=1 Tax=Brucella/Ochrobactrum group TaxID=2826938 RepID=UPI000D705806|nr:MULTISPECIES: YbgC/FadM family acyl-CoA thioesterase [Brucella/Ochrobactrum group]MCH4540706.1 YbgC/FadM family acyl-CoA thioesterase [Ochrobactrum sp. A-1]PWU71520.1 4-hydroxybenzoyl-CoA thioesterase [Ochrobactrum sp. POC9]
MTERQEQLAQAAVSGELKDGAHLLYARIYYADTDFSGFVYHGRYLEFYERGRTDFLRLQDVHHIELAEGALGEEMVWVVRRMEIDYKSPAKMDDLILIETRVSEIRGARVIMAQKITCGERLLSEAKVEAVMITKAGHPRRIPDEWREAFTNSRKD